MYFEREEKKTNRKEKRKKIKIHNAHLSNNGNHLSKGRPALATAATGILATPRKSLFPVLSQSTAFLKKIKKIFKKNIFFKKKPKKRTINL